MGTMQALIGQLKEASEPADKAALISKRIKMLLMQGKSIKDAMDAVLGAGTYDKVVSDLYDELRAKAGKGKA
jgi:hypothetical protein